MFAEYVWALIYPGLAASSAWNAGLAFAWGEEDLHISTLWNHIILMRMQMNGKLWEMALHELLVKNVLLGRGCCQGEGEPSSLLCRVSGGRFLGDSNWVALGQVWRKHIFIDVPIVTGSYSWYLNNSCRFWQLFPFPIYTSLFILVKFLRARGGSREGRCEDWSRWAVCDPLRGLAQKMVPKMFVLEGWRGKTVAKGLYVSHFSSILAPYGAFWAPPGVISVNKTRSEHHKHGPKKPPNKNKTVVTETQGSLGLPLICEANLLL